MANKYDLVLVKNDSEKKIYQQPWYKERLKTKYIKSRNLKDTSQLLNGRDWRFMKDGLDDFRDGLPPAVKDSIFVENRKGPGPALQGDADSSRVKQPAMRNRFTHEEMCFSKATPHQQHRREQIEDIQSGLLQHPLAIFPHLENSVEPDVFEDVIDVLDPEMNMASDDEESYRNELDEIESNDTPEPAARETKHELEQPAEEEAARNPYKWLPRKEEKDRRDRKKAERNLESPSQDEHIKSVTSGFCKWVSDLGGEQNNIEESTIMSLFASGYETKPALSVPIHVVELTNVPPELRQNAQLPAAQTEESRNLPAAKQKKKPWGVSGTYEPSWQKIRYGAWYLPAKSWKKMEHDEELLDPKKIKEQETSEAKKRSEALDHELAPMHGSKAFIDFLESRKGNKRRPEFLDRVETLQREAARREEEKKLEAENLKNRRASRGSGLLKAQANALAAGAK